MFLLMNHPRHQARSLAFALASNLARAPPGAWPCLTIRLFKTHRPFIRKYGPSTPPIMNNPLYQVRSLAFALQPRARLRARGRVSFVFLKRTVCLIRLFKAYRPFIRKYGPSIFQHDTLSQARSLAFALSSNLARASGRVAVSASLALVADPSAPLLPPDPPGQVKPYFGHICSISGIFVLSRAYLFYFGCVRTYHGSDGRGRVGIPRAGRRPFRAAPPPGPAGAGET